MGAIFKVALDLVKTDTVMPPFTGNVRLYADSSNILWQLLNATTKYRILTSAELPLAPASGGTGLDGDDISAAAPGDILQLNSSGGFSLNPMPLLGHIIEGGTTAFAQRSILRFAGSGIFVQDDEEADATVVTVNLDLPWPADKGGTGQGRSQIEAASPGDILQLTDEKTFILTPIPQSGHQVAYGDDVLPDERILSFRGYGVQAYDDAEAGQTVVEVGGVPGKYFTFSFVASDFVDGQLVVEQESIPFAILNPILAVRDSAGEYVECGIVVDMGTSITLTAQPFAGTLIISEPGGAGTGFFYSKDFKATDFVGNQLVIGQGQITIDLIDPIIAVMDSSGTYVSCGVAVVNNSSITITAYPFDGRLVLFRGDLQRSWSGHRILAPNGDFLVQRTDLQFVGNGVSVTDDSQDGRTVVTITGGGGGGGNLATVAFETTEFTGTTLVVPASAIPFTYSTPILQVMDSAGRYVIAALSIDATTKAITIEAEPFDGTLIVFSN